MDRNLLSSVSLYEEQIRKAEHMHDHYLEKINEYELKLKATKKAEDLAAQMKLGI